MASPIALSGMSIGASAGGGLLSAVGSIFGGKSQKKMYDYQSAVARLNADIDRQNAEWELTKGGIEGQQFGLRAGQQFAQIRTAQGASNLDVNSGSAVAVQGSQRKLNYMDEATIASNAAKTAYDYTAKAAADESQAKLYSAAGENARTAGYIGAASSIIGTAGSVSSKWLQAKTAGIYGDSASSSNPYYAPLDYNG